MLGIVFDVIKFAQDYKRDEVLYLQSLLRERDEKISMLETIIFRRFGLTQEERPLLASDKKVVGSVSGWREQQKMLENKFRPPEFVEREQRFREIAEKEADELKAREES